MNDMNFDERLKLDNFSQPTTYLNDYRLYAPQKIIKHKWPKDTIEKPTKPPAEFHETDIETFYPFKKELHVPFNLLWHPRPILETDPKRPYPKDLKPREDVDREEVIKTRPRLYMSPAVSLDDVEEKEMREMLCKGVYQTELRRAEEEVWKYLQKSKRDVFETVLDADHGIEYDFDPYPPLPEAWRKAGIKWDNQQKRALVDPTKQFWLNTKIEPRTEGNPFGKLVPKEVKEEIAELIEDERLRLPHDKLKPGYAGYQPKLSKGVTLPQSDFPITHPSMTVAQVIAARWRDA